MKKLLLTIICALALVQAGAETFDVATPGSLSSLIGNRKYKITELTLTGNINGTDIALLRDMAGADLTGNSTRGALATLNLKGARIVAGGNAYFNSDSYGKLLTEDDYLGPMMFCGCTALKRFAMPEGVETVGMSAMALCPLEELEFSPNLREVGPGAFQGSRLTQVTFPESVEQLWPLLFADNTVLRIVNLGSRVALADRSFAECKALERINVSAENKTYKDIDGVLFTAAGDVLIQYPNMYATAYALPEGVEFVGPQAFSRCTNLREIDFTPGLTAVANDAFRYCSSLERVGFNADLQEIGANAFYDCKVLVQCALPSSLTYVGDAAFSGAGIRTLTLGENLSEVGESAFASCEALQSVALSPNLATTYGEGAFCYCTSLRKIDFGATPTLPNSMFSNCTALPAATLPATVKEVGDLVFAACTSMATINLGAGVTRIGQSAFSDCASLTELIIPDQVTTLGDALAGNATSLRKVSIGNGVTTMGEFMFAYCSSLREVELGNSLTTLPNAIFCGCTSLERVALGNNITTVGDYAFSFCSRLSEVALPPSLTSAGNNSFSFCDLRAITLPATLRHLGPACFAYNPSLTSVTSLATLPPTCGEGAFDMISPEATLTTPPGTAEAYAAAPDDSDSLPLLPADPTKLVDISTLAPSIPLAINDHTGRLLHPSILPANLSTLPRGLYLLRFPTHPTAPARKLLIP